MTIPPDFDLPLRLIAQRRVAGQRVTILLDLFTGVLLGLMLSRKYHAV
jgi:hypothetical protein